MTNSATTTTSTDRSSTSVNLKRADALNLGDQVLLPRWDGTVELATVVALALVGDDVEMTFAARQGELSTSQGNTFQVVQVCQ